MLQGIEQDISELLLKYIAVHSDTGTAEENNTDRFFQSCLDSEPYFIENPGHFGAYAIHSDALNRSVNWALVKGTGEGTVVLIHHSDTVGTEDYKQLAVWARDPDALSAELKKGNVKLSAEAQDDLESGVFLFGHGTADMKAGGAIQLSLLKRFSHKPHRTGNILLLALPDEENLSQGMRNSSLLMESLKEQFGLDYRLMINSEPHQRKDPKVGMFSEGSVGKILPFVYVRGVLAHAGQIFSGLNPVNPLSEIVRRMELNVDICDIRGCEVSPPPTCLFLKDSKEHYDVSIPRSAFACFSILTLGKSPVEILTLLEKICRESAEKVLGEMNRNHSRYQTMLGETPDPLPWKMDVLRFDHLLQTASANAPDSASANSTIQEAVQNVQSGARSMAQGTWDTVESVLDQMDERDPVIVVGFVPPYYPSVTNDGFGKPSHRAMTLTDHLIQYASDTLGQDYSKEMFYTGISDLSYSSIQHGSDLENALVPNMPLHGPAYSIPFGSIRKTAMPCINIGPWGKDFHKLTERVHREDMLVATPQLIQEAIRFMLEDAPD